MGSTTSTDLTALVTLLGGTVSSVAIGTDLDALDGRGRAFLAQQGCNADYELCEVEAMAGANVEPRGCQPVVEFAHARMPFLVLSTVC